MITPAPDSHPLRRHVTDHSRTRCWCGNHTGATQMPTDENPFRPGDRVVLRATGPERYQGRGPGRVTDAAGARLNVEWPDGSLGLVLEAGDFVHAAPRMGSPR